VGERVFSDTEMQLLLDACGKLSPAKGNYLETDYVSNLFLTVLDFMMHGAVVGKAIDYYAAHERARIRTCDELRAVLERYTDDENGNRALAQHLWGNNHWTRAALLRRLTDFLGGIGVTDQRALKEWADRSDFRRDFRGKVKGLGHAVYQWLVMRQGIETVKPDVHLHRFVTKVIGRECGDEELVCALEHVAERLHLKAYELDWRIWEHERGGAG
jgi:hypothetical protein